MIESRMIVFKEIDNNNEKFFQWFKLSEDGQSIIPDKILDELTHWSLVNAD